MVEGGSTDLHRVVLLTQIERHGTANREDCTHQLCGCEDTKVFKMVNAGSNDQRSGYRLVYEYPRFIRGGSNALTHPFAIGGSAYFVVSVAVNVTKLAPSTRVSKCAHLCTPVTSVVNVFTRVAACVIDPKHSGLYLSRYGLGCPRCYRIARRRFRKKKPARVIKRTFPSVDGDYAIIAHFTALARSEDTTDGSNYPLTCIPFFDVTDEFICQSGFTGSKGGEKRTNTKRAAKVSAKDAAYLAKLEAQTAAYMRFADIMMKHETIDQRAQHVLDSLPQPNDVEDALFSHRSYKGTKLNGLALGIKMSLIPAFMGSLINYEPTCVKTPAESARYREQKRAAAAVGNWHTPEGLERLRDFVLLVLTDEHDDSVISHQQVHPLPHQQYVQDHRLRMGRPSNSHFQTTSGKRGKEVAAKLFFDYSRTNIVHTLFMQATASTSQLTPQKIKSILRSHLATSDPYKALAVLEHKMFYAKPGELATMEPRRLSWCLPYVHPELFHIFSATEAYYEQIFCSLVLDLRERILTFARSYINLGLLTPRERKAAIDGRSAEFVEHLRSPEIQKLYLCGMSHEQVTEIVNERFSSQLTSKLTDVDAVYDMRDAKKLAKKMSIYKARRQKEDYNNYWASDEFVCESLTLTTVAVTGLFGLMVIALAVVAAIAIELKDELTATIRVARRELEATSASVQSAVRATEAVPQTAASAIEEVMARFRNPLAGVESLLTPDTKVQLLEVKSLIHLVYHCCMGNAKSAIEWASNFVVTRPEMVVAAVQSLTSFMQDAGRAANPLMTIWFAGEERNVTPEAYDQLIEYHARLRPREYATQVYRLTTSAVQLQTRSAVSGVLTSVLGALGYFEPGAEMSDQDIRAANNAFTYVNNKRRGVSDTAETVVETLSLLFRYMYGCDPFNRDYQAHVSLLIQLVTYTDKLGTDLGFFSKVEDMKVCVGMAEAAQKAILSPLMESTPGFITNRFKAILPVLLKRGLESRAKLSGSETRKEPLSIMLTGPPGVGKSALTQYLMKAVAKIENTVHTPAEVYTFDPTLGFWEGYTYQNWVVMDDIFASQNIEHRQNESITLLRAVNINPYCLNMAFGDKGLYYFRSRYVIMSTNQCNEGYKNTHWVIGLADVGAFERRIHLVVHKTTKLGDDLMKEQYRVDKCICFPEVVGRMYTPAQLAHLVARMKAHRDGMADGFAMTADEIAASLVDVQEPGPDPEPPAGDVVVQSGKSDRQSAFQRARACGDCPDLIGSSDDDDEDPDRCSRYELSPKDTGVVLMEPPAPYAKYEPPPAPRKTHTESLIDSFVAATFGIQFKPRLFSSEELVQTMADLNMYTFWSESVRPNLPMILTILLAVAAGGAAYYYMFGKDAPPFDTDSRPQKHNGGWKTNRPRFQKAKNRGIRKIKSFKQNWKGTRELITPSSKFQAVFPQSGFGVEEMLSGPSAATCFVEALSNLPGEVCNAYHLRDGYFMIPSHFFAKYVNEDDVTLRITPRGRPSMDVPFPTEHIAIDNEDIFVFKATGKDFRLPPQGIQYLYEPGKTWYQFTEGTPLYILSATFGAASFRGVHIAHKAGVVTYEKNGETFIMDDPLTYWEHTQGGDSGSAIVYTDYDGRPKVVGMHVGRKGGIGIALPVCKQDAETLIGELNKVTTQSAPSHIPVLRSTTPAWNHPTNSPIERSDIYGWAGPPTRVPAKLKPFTVDGVTIDPLKVAQSKLTHEPFVSDDPIDPRVVDFLLDHYQKPPDLKVGPVNWDENLRGDTAKGSIGICHSTSPGYPYCVGHGKGKAPWITHEQVDGNFHMEYQPEFLNKLIDLDNRLQAGEKLEFLWMDVLKAELRPREKVAEGKTRLIAAAPLDALFLFRKYFLDLVTFIQKKATTHFVSVGINPHSPQWSLLNNRLRRPDGSVIAGDYSNYDGRVPKKAGRQFLEFANRWYGSAPGSPDAIARATLLENVWNALRVSGFDVYQCAEGNPSGNPITSIYNSITNAIMLLDVLMNDLGLDIIDDNVDMVLYGDDHVVSTDRPGLTVDHLAVPMKRRYGMTITHFSKQQGYAPVDSIEDVRFLQRLFLRQETVCRAPLPIETIVESTYWYGSATHHREILKSILQSFYVELSHHPKDVFDYYDSLLYEKLKRTFPHGFDDLLVGRHTYSWFSDAMYRDQRHMNVWVQSHLTSTPDLDPPMTGLFIKESYQGEFQVQSRETQNSFEGNVAETRNTEYTERAVNEPTTTEVVELGTYNDVSEVSQTAVTGIVTQLPHDTTNMETFDMNATLCREYLVPSITWAASSAAGAQLYKLNLFGFLMSQAYLRDKMGDFRYFVGGFKITVRAAATQFQYGKIMASFNLPGDIFDPDASPASIYEASGRPHILVSASSAEVVTLHVPFISPKRALDLSSYTADELGYIRFQVVNPLYSTTTAIPDAKLIVTVSFDEPRVWLAHDRLLTQSGKGAEAKKKAVTGTISASNEVSRPIRAMVRNTAGILGDVYSRVLGGAADAAGGALVGAMMGLSKPSSTQIGQIVKINPYSDTAAGKGIDTAIKLAMDPENAITTEPVVGGFPADEMDLSVFMGTPAMCNSVSFLPASSAIELCTLGPYDASLTYVDAITRNFAWWSGSYKIKLYITAALFQQARFVLWLGEVSPATTNWEQCYHKEFEVQGDSIIEFTVPYVGPKFGSTASSYSIWCKPLSWVQPDPVLSNPIAFNVYKAAASDFKVYTQMETAFTPQSNPREDFMKEFEPLHPSFTGFSHSALISGDNFTTMREILHRYSAVGSTNNTSRSIYDTPDAPTTDTWYGPERWGLFFRFWRGSVRYKFMQGDAASRTKAVYLLLDGKPISGWTSSSENTPAVEFEAPYVSDNLYESTDLDTVAGGKAYVYKMAKSTAYSFYITKAFGDDFSFHFMRLPPIAIAPPSSSFGQAGLVTFLNTA